MYFQRLLHFEVKEDKLSNSKKVLRERDILNELQPENYGQIGNYCDRVFGVGLDTGNNHSCQLSLHLSHLDVYYNCHGAKS